MEIFLYVEEDNRISGWSSTPINDVDEPFIVEEDDPVLVNPMIYSLIDGKLVRDDTLILESVRKNKDDELNQSCKDAILAGFNHEINGEVYWFSYDMEAQGNFRDGREVLKDGLVESLPWTVRAGGIDGPYTRIIVNFEIMSELTIAAMMHKTEKISKYRDFLMPIVEGATSVEEIESVKW